MANIDVITGLPLEEGQKSTIEVKKMCYNCSFCKDTKCINEVNLQAAKEKLLAAVPNGYEVTNVELSPIALKDPSKKCGNWNLNQTIVTQALIGLF